MWGLRATAVLQICTYFLDIAKQRYTKIFIFWNGTLTDREGVFECKNMKVKLLAVILRPSLKRLDKYKSSIAQPISREVTFFFIDFMIKKWDRTKNWVLGSFVKGIPL